MQTLDPTTPAGFAPKPVSSRIFIRCYRHYGEAKHAYDQLRVVAGIPEKRMTVVARGLEWREPLPSRCAARSSLCGLAPRSGRSSD